MASLTIFRIGEAAEGSVPSAFDDVIDPGVLGSCQIHDYTDSYLTARLYIAPADSEIPRWATFVRGGFPAAMFATSAVNQAVVVASVRHRNRERVFALCFGPSRTLVRKSLIDPVFGRRVVLNLVAAESGTSALSQGRIRQVDARTIEDNVRRSRVQRSRDTVFESFGVDPQRDLLDRIVGAPSDTERFGRRVAGGESLRLEVGIAFDELGGLLRQILSIHSRTTYRNQFAWTDRVRTVKDPALIARLRDRAVQLLLDGTGTIELAPPEVVDWDRISTFVYELGDREEHNDLRLEDYLEVLDRSRARELDYQRMATHRVTAKDSDGVPIAHWSVARTLVGEFPLDDSQYIVDDGRFFVVAADYFAELNSFVESIGQPSSAFPSTSSETLEDTYNKLVASSAPSWLLLDKKTVKPGARTTAIEICDLLSSRGEVVHVKRKLGSADLSHLFSQGYVSAECMWESSDARDVIREKIKQQAKVRKRDAGAFTQYIEEPFSAGELTIVYAILADWKGRAPKDRLPFFSKVNLRHFVQLMKRMGFNVAIAAVDAD